MGIVKGRGVTRSGNPVHWASVSGKIPGFMGGFSSARTDRDGRFVLENPGDGKLEYVYVEGGEKQNDVRSGSTLTLYK